MKTVCFRILKKKKEKKMKQGELFDVPRLSVVSENHIYDIN